MSANRAPEPPMANEAPRSVDVLLKDVLSRLVAAAPKKHKELRDECTAGLEKLEAATGVVNADEYFRALKYGCEAAGSPKVVQIALDAIAKLMASNYLSGTGPDPFKEDNVGGQPRTLMDSIIDAICGSAEQQQDDAVQQLIVRALSTALTSQTLEVHGASLMKAVSSCFAIHRDSKNPTNQRTAHAALTQILQVVTQKMEQSSSDRRSLTTESGDRVTPKAPPSSDLALQPPAKVLEDWMSSYVNRLVDQVCLQKDPAQGGGTAEMHGRPGKFGWCIVCRAPAAHYCVDTRDPVCGHPCKFKNLERLNLVETHYGGRRDDEEQPGPPVAAVEAECEKEQTDATIPLAAAPRMESVMGDEQAAVEMGVEHGEKALSIHHLDALMVFSSLCKQSMKDLPPGQTDSRIVKSKRLSLELILGMLQNCGPVFRSSEPFIAVLKKSLCVSLIKNSVSSIPKVFHLSLQIFVLLIPNFKDHLKTEIGVFIEQIFLRILESGNSTFQHKLRVLQVFYKLCTDASTALELFINFDCDVDEKNIFERMIDCLSKIAQGKYTSSEHANLIRPEQELELKMLALQAVVTLMGSIVDWARRMSEDKRDLSKTEVARVDGESDGEEDAQSDAAYSTSAGASTAPTASTLSAIVEQKQRKHELQIGVNKFNMKPKRGIEYLKQNGFFGDDPLTIADFFRNQDLGLDKGQVGDFLGEDKPFNKSILYALVDSQDFSSLELDFALRAFLSTFRLPGEAQKIDRMMEKFAEKFCQDNPGKFTTADCAYVLSFSLIMLQTDLHNPGIKKKMSKEDFVWNNRGINDGSDLPKEYLEKLYESVKENPFSLDEDQEARNRMESQAAQGATQKFELFVRETESIVQKSQELMKQKVLKNKDSKYVAAQNVEHVRPLFEVACWPMLATLAVLLEMQDAAQSVELCIDGFKHCIRIAARFDMDTERDAFVSSLAKFTYLTTLKEMKQKNIECIKALMSIALSEGNNLGPSWQYVLHCISQLDRMQLINIRARQDFQYFQEEEAKGAAARPDGQSAVVKRRAYGTGVSALMAMGADDKQLELVNSESVMAQIDAAQIDLLFNRSSSLASGAIVHFVTQLARVSKEELAVPEQPRIFSLQKLVEVADFNMGRIRIVWSKIWRVLALHFIEAASHPNIKVCMYAIDSLRQLSMKFLEKDELSNYNFQVEFLRPFETVMLNSGGTVSKEVKEYIVSIISNMVQSRITNIKSGWKIVFHILRAAAQEHNTKAVPRSAFIVMDTVVQQHFEIFVENFSEGVRALLAFGQCKAELELSLRAITYLLQAAEYLADSSKPDPPPPSSKEKEAFVAPAGEAPGSAANGSHPAAHWFPILRGLSTLVGDPRREIRAAALDGVFECLREYGSAVFDEDTWRMAFNGVIKPLFDDIHHQLADQRKSEGTASDGKDASWAVSMVPPTCLAALTALVRLFDAQIESLGFLLDEVLKLLENCIQHDTEAVARIGVEGFKQLLLLAGKKLQPHQWEKVTQCILQLFNDSMPTQLLCTDTQSSGDQLPFRRDDVVIKCVVQLLLIDMLQDTVSQHYSQIPPAGVMTLVDALQQSFEFAQEFNKQIELRQVLKKRGFMPEMRQLPGLLKQEREALSCSLKILFQVQTDPKIRGSGYASTAVERLMRLCSSVLSNYVAKERMLQEQSDAQAAEGEKKALVVEIEREVLGLVPIVSEVVLRGLKDLEQEQFAKYLPGMFPLLAELVAVNSREVRVVVRDILVEQVAPHFPERPATT